MKTLRVYLAIFSICLAFGFSMMLLSPTTTQANQDPCSATCYSDHCAPASAWGCPTLYSFERCYAPRTSPCDPPPEYNCRCRLLYCTDDACNIW